MPSRATMRLDKWLVQARFCKTRTVATELVESGHVRVNGQKTRKPAHAVGDGDALTFPQGGRIRVIRILDMPLRRGPASEAQALYDDLAEDVPRPANEGE
ncbi:S4 domain-containing protein [Falsirhodobacter xinxiangensis]|uniref:S4 domain-containing protein n=1 Tax=Falsirhodobacter xinxiangensis TaxID=2530049 RepID=UPI00145C1685